MAEENTTFASHLKSTPYQLSISFFPMKMRGFLLIFSKSCLEMFDIAFLIAEQVDLESSDGTGEVVGSSEPGLLLGTSKQ